MLRMLTNLSRTYAHLLILLDLDIDLTRPQTGISILHDSAFAYSGGGRAKNTRQQQQPVVTKAIKLQEELRETLSRMLVDGVDVLVAVHRPEQISGSQEETVHSGRSTVVVEVVKDRVGDGLGHWGLWDYG